MGTSSRKINSRQKGARGEREAAAFLRALGIGAERGRQHHGGPDSPDVKTALPGVHFEVKRVERFNLSKAMAQARKEKPVGAVPAVLSRKNHEEWLLTIPLGDLWRLWQRLEPFYEAAMEVGEEPCE